MGLFQDARPLFQDASDTIRLVPPRRTPTFGSASSSTNPSGYEAVVLRKGVGFSIVLFLVLFAAIVQVLNAVINYHFHGLGPVTSTTNTGSLTHYFWSAPTIAGIVLSACASAAIAALDFSLKRIEPYRQLGQGNTTADGSLLLDYLGSSQVFVWRKALRNGHWIVVLSSVACLLSLVLSPLASTLFVIRSSFRTQEVPVIQSQSFALPPGWDALVPSYSATNLIASIFLANGTLPAYVTSEWAVPSFELNAAAQGGISSNATLQGVLPGIRSYANCEDTDIQWQELSGDYRFNATIKGKQSGKTVEAIYPGYPAVGRTVFTASISPLNGQSDPRLQSFVYQIFTPLTEDSNEANTVGHPNMSTIVCSPTVQSQYALVALDSGSRTLLSAQPQPGDHKPPSNLTFLNGTGSAGFNGFYFNTSMYGPIVDQRKKATQFGLVSVMYQAALNYPGGLAQAYADNAHYNLTSTIYQNYLSLMALKNYLNNTAPQDNIPLMMSSTTLQNLLFVSQLSAILISSVLLVLVFLVLAALISHWRTSGTIGLRVDPGSMAGTGMTMVGGDVAKLLDDPDMTRREMKAALRRHTWSLVDGKVCVAGGLGDSEDRGNDKDPAFGSYGVPSEHLLNWPS